MQILDGKATAQALRRELAQRVEAATQAGHRPPHLAAVLVGNHPASRAYVRNKMRACAEIGYRSSLIELPDDISQEAMLAQIEAMNADADLDAYIVQLPLPPQLDAEALIEAIDPKKDADGFHPYNLGRMTLNQETLLPATPYGVLLLLEHYGIDTQGKRCVILGRSHIVGRPLSILLSSPPYNATVTVCHSRSRDLAAETQAAEILVAAIGKPRFVGVDMLPKGGVVIDVGINAIEEDGKHYLVGDVDEKAAENLVSALTPVPGGVGPMTIVGLLYNTWTVYARDFGV